MLMPAAVSTGGAHPPRASHARPCLGGHHGPLSARPTHRQLSPASPGVSGYILSHVDPLTSPNGRDGDKARKRPNWLRQSPWPPLQANPETRQGDPDPEPPQGGEAPGPAHHGHAYKGQ